jgi:hypothetical protein
MLFVPEEAPEDVWSRLLEQRTESDVLRSEQLWSHALFLFPILVCVLLGRRYFAATLLSASVLTSLLYHACLAYDTCAGTGVGVRRSLDHVTANLNIIAGLSMLTGARDDALADRDVRHRNQLDYLKVVVPLEVLAVAYAVLVAPYSLYIAYVAYVAALVAIVAYGLFFRSPPRLSIGAGAYVIEPLAVSSPYVVGALVAAGLGVAAFLINVGGESWPHSAWHMLIAIALGLLALGTGLPPDGPATVVAYRLEQRDRARLQALAKRGRMRNTRRTPGRM